MKYWAGIFICCLIATNAYALFSFCVGDYVWEDNNRNGIQDVGESSVPNVLISYEWHRITGVVDTGQCSTDENGLYLIDWLGHGTIVITAVIPDGYTLIAPFQGDNEYLDSDFQMIGENIAYFEADIDDLYAKYGHYCLCIDLGLVKNNPLESNCRTVGFWKNNVRKCLNGENGKQVLYTDLIDWLLKVQDYYLDNPYLLGYSDTQILENAYDILSYNGASIRGKLLKQLLACELNLLSNEYLYIDIAEQDSVCKQAENALNSPTNFSLLHDLHDYIDWMNNQE